MKSCFFLVFVVGTVCSLPLRAEKLSVLVIAQEKFQDRELNETRSFLTSQGYRVLIAAGELKPAKGMLGSVITPDITIESIDPAATDLLAVIGGTGSVKLWENSVLIDRLRLVHTLGKPVAAICLAPGVLSMAGLLTGVKATCFPLEKAVQLLETGGAVYSTEPVVTDGLIITGNGPEATAAWARELAAALK